MKSWRKWLPWVLLPLPLALALAWWRAKPTPAIGTALWRSYDGSLWESPGWLGWWTVRPLGTIFNDGKPPF